MVEGTTFGAWLKRRRKEYGYTQQELAQLVGCSTITITKIEADERRPSRQIVDLLAQHLEIRPDERVQFAQFARAESGPLTLPPLTEEERAPWRAIASAEQAALNAPALASTPIPPPSGTLTFLFTDIEGSTRLWEERFEAMGGAVARHDELLRSVIEAHGGYVFKTVGDAFYAAFPVARQALEAAIEAQRILNDENWSAIGQ